MGDAVIGNTVVKVVLDPTMTIVKELLGVEVKAPPCGTGTILVEPEMTTVELAPPEEIGPPGTTVGVPGTMMVEPADT